MFVDLVFSFLLSTWKSLPELGFDPSYRGVILSEAATLCGLERAHLLGYDGQWHEKESLNIPIECSDALPPYSLTKIEVKSETLNSLSQSSAWDQRVSLKVNGKDFFTIYLRQDKHFVGAHSSNGWSMWVERRSGQFRFEYLDQMHTNHLRMKALGILNPLKGGFSSVQNLEALYVENKDGKAQTAITISGSNEGGLRTLIYRDQRNEWIQTDDQCSLKQGCKHNSTFQVDQGMATKFASVRCKMVDDFINGGLPLAFTSVMPEEVVPQVGNFR